MNPTQSSATHRTRRAEYIAGVKIRCPKGRASSTCLNKVSRHSDRYEDIVLESMQALPDCS